MEAETISWFQLTVGAALAAPEVTVSDGLLLSVLSHDSRTSVFAALLLATMADEV